MALVELARFNNRTEAELARLNLEVAGLDVVLFDAEMNSFGLGPIMSVRLMVLDDQYAEAAALLADEGML